MVLVLVLSLGGLVLPVDGSFFVAGISPSVRSLAFSLLKFYILFSFSITASVCRDVYF
jgi:hypothetical protein